ncbi:MAG: hypothetical protein H7039_19490 [Bryobacteraceae bacterium]|nr:hypothetical protein [Bryobacteraceae bacterium]
MPELSFSNQISEDPEFSAKTQDKIEGLRRERTLERTVRFHLLLNLGLALAATWVLKVDGPYYADGIAAGVYVCGLAVTVISMGEIKVARRQLKELTPNLEIGSGLTRLFLVFALFFLCAACAVIWFTYIAPQDLIYPEDDGVASALWRQFA